MKKQAGNNFEPKEYFPFQLRKTLAVVAVLASVMGAASVLSRTLPLVFAQDAAAPRPAGLKIHGVVRDSANKPVAGASVRLDSQMGTPGKSDVAETKTNAEGSFEFAALQPCTCTVQAQKSGIRSRIVTVPTTSHTDQAGTDLVIDLILEAPGAFQTTKSAASPSSSAAMEFADKPNFTVAGVTDWTAVGGHGSDAILRTSETLARETITLKPEGSGDNSAVSQGKSIALLRNAYRLDPAIQ